MPTQLQDKLAGSLKEYFDPQSGRFHERVQQLVKQDGELEQLLRRQIGGEDSELCQDAGGPFRPAKPADEAARSQANREGLLRRWARRSKRSCTAQRDHVLREFSLDNKEGRWRG